MTCRELADFLLDYLAGELPTPLREAFDRHLALCPNCCVYLANYEQTVRAGRLAFADDEEVPLPEELVHAILAAQREAR